MEAAEEHFQAQVAEPCFQALEAEKEHFQAQVAEQIQALEAEEEHFQALVAEPIQAEEECFQAQVAEQSLAQEAEEPLQVHVAQVQGQQLAQAAAPEEFQPQGMSTSALVNQD